MTDKRKLGKNVAAVLFKIMTRVEPIFSLTQLVADEITKLIRGEIYMLMFVVYNSRGSLNILVPYDFCP